MQVTIDLPNDVAAQFQTNGKDLLRNVMETLALAAYRRGDLTHAQVMRMLGFSTPMEVDAFLKQSNVYLEYSTVELAEDRETHRQMRSK